MNRRINDEQRDVSYDELVALQQEFETQLDENHVIFDDDDDYDEALNDFIQQYIDGDDDPQIDFSMAKVRPVRDSKRRQVKDSSTDVYTIEIYDDTDTEDVTPMNLQHDYYDIDEAIADLEVAMESFKDNPNEICGWVLAGEYLTEKGEVYGEPEVVYELCNY